MGLPYDHNRVELDEYVGDTDYINASWIAIEKPKQPIPQNQNFSQKPKYEVDRHYSPQLITQKTKHNAAILILAHLFSSTPV